MRLLAVLATAILCAPIAAFAADQDFTIVNRTGYQIDSVYVSAVNARDWGEDILGKQSLGDGEHANITFNGHSSACHWDIKVVYNDGDDASWGDVNLCNISKVTLFWNQKNQETRAVVE